MSQHQQYPYNGSSTPARSAYPTQDADKWTDDDYRTDDELAAEKRRNVAVGVSSAAFLAVLGFLCWKYALDEPQNWDETKDAFGELFDDVGDKWNEWDLGNFTDVLDGLDDISFGDLFNEDPMGGSNVTTRWHSDFIGNPNSGLNLKLVNALDDTWQQEFSVAVADWQESDALSLVTERVDVDHTCKRQDDVMVVCNANFGATGE